MISGQMVLKIHNNDGGPSSFITVLGDGGGGHQHVVGFRAPVQFVRSVTVCALLSPAQPASVALCFPPPRGILPQAAACVRRRCERPKQTSGGRKFKDAKKLNSGQQGLDILERNRSYWSHIKTYSKI